MQDIELTMTEQLNIRCGSESSSSGVPSIFDEYGQESAGLARKISSSSSISDPYSIRKSSDFGHGEAFHDARSWPEEWEWDSADIREDGSVQAMFKISELLPTDSTGIEETDWRKYAPPAELLEIPDGTKQELVDIMEASLGELQNRMVAEDLVREAANTTAIEAVDNTLETKGKGKGKARVVENMFAAEASVISRNMDNFNLPNRTYYGEREFSHDLGSRRRSMHKLDAAGYSLRPRAANDKGKERSKFGFGSLFKKSRRNYETVQILTVDNRPAPEAVSPPPQVFASSSVAQGIHQSISSLASSSVPEERPSIYSLTEVECVSCLDDFYQQDCVKLTCHSYCKGCFKNLIQNALSSETYWPVKCCLNEIPEEKILQFLDKATRKQYEAISEERSIPAGERMYCSTANCNKFIPSKQTHKDTTTAVCLSCKKSTCTMCRNPFHPSSDCPADPTLRATLALADDEGWKRCYRCHALVEHNNGCIHMTCNCSAQFCYICCAMWRTCSCSDSQLQELRRGAAERGRLRRQREEALEEVARIEQVRRETREAEEEEARQIAAEVAQIEARELQSMLAQIEEFEAREAAKLAAEAEKQRKEAARRREKRQNEYLQSVNIRFGELRSELDVLNFFQKISMTQRYDKEARAVRDRRAAKEEMEMRHLRELTHEISVAERKVAESEVSMKNDLRERMVAQKRIEDTYFKQLRTYWQSQTMSDKWTRFSRAKDEFIEQTDVAQGEYVGVRKAEHQRVVVEGRQKVTRLKQRHALDIEAGDLKDVSTSRTPSLEDRRRKWADDRWLEQVVTIREEMLAALEGSEYAREVV